MARAIDWYSRLFESDPGATSHQGGIYDVPMQGETGLVLDANKPISGHFTQPLCQFLTEDIDASLRRLEQMGAHITSEPQDIGSVVFFTFADSDGNPLMICEREPG